MKFYIYTENEAKGSALKKAKQLAIDLFPDAEIKAGVGKPRKNKKNSESFDEFTFIKLEDFWKSELKQSALALCDLTGMGISERTIERL